MNLVPGSELWKDSVTAAKSQAAVVRKLGRLLFSLGQGVCVGLYLEVESLERSGRIKSFQTNPFCV